MRFGHTMVTCETLPNFIKVLLGAGDGTFGSPYSYYAGFGPTGLCLANFDNDSGSGIGTVTHKTPTVTVLFNSTNEFSVEQCLRADVNGDGSVDPFDGMYLINYMWNGGPAPVPCE